MRRLAVIALVAVTAASCSGGDVPGGPTVDGVVVAVDGDLSAVTSFTVMDAAGETHVFVPADGLTFDGGPLSHLTAHLTSGEPVRVAYEDAADGGRVAVHITDA